MHVLNFRTLNSNGQFSTTYVRVPTSITCSGLIRLARHWPGSTWVHHRPKQLGQMDWTDYATMPALAEKSILVWPHEATRPLSVSIDMIKRCWHLDYFPSDMGFLNINWLTLDFGRTAVLTGLGMVRQPVLWNRWRGRPLLRLTFFFCLFASFI
jgi:hypothetical protein